MKTISAADPTGMDRTFTISGIAAGDTYLVAVNCSNSDPFIVREYYAPGSSTWVYKQAGILPLHPGDNVQSIRFDLDTGGVVTGTVNEADGTTPITGKPIAVYLESNEDGFNASMYISQTDGSFRFNGVPAGAYKLNTNIHEVTSGYNGKYYDNKGDAGAADPVNVTVENINSGMNLNLDRTTTTTVTPSGRTINVVDQSGSEISLQVPSNAVSQNIQLTYIPMPPVSSSIGFAIPGAAFSLEASVSGQTQAHFTFNQPVLVRFTYTDAQIYGTEEDTLKLSYWNETSGQWEEAACGPYQRFPNENRIEVPICHLSLFS
jgi:hypothetical protein